MSVVTMKADDFVAEMAALRLPGVFNPYGERCPLDDRADACVRRQGNLRRILEASNRRAGKIDCWIGRDLGYRGGRRTGVPFTDDTQLDVAAARYGVKLCRATRGNGLAERSAGEIWRAIVACGVCPMLWNVFPLHPHPPGQPLRNRRHTAAEARIGTEILLALLRMLRPVRLIAIGRDAQQALMRAHLPHLHVRHPSYGGVREFRHGIFKIHDIQSNNVYS